MVILAILIALFFALNIGASGAAASMGIAYGTGVVKKGMALFLCAIAVFLGAYLGGGEVVKTLGSGIVPGHTFTVSVTILVLLSAALSLFLANILGIPLSTSEVVVGAIVGVGIVYQSLFFDKLAWILLFWVLTPFVAFIMAVVAAMILKIKKIKKWLEKPSISRILPFIVIAMGMFEAFSAGMNNVANAVGPLVGAEILSIQSGIFWGGLFVALGALILGKRVLETNGKKITSIRLEDGCIISGTGASIVMAASLFGIPVPLTQITTSSIIGIGFVKDGINVLKKKIVIQLLTVWVVSPIISMALSYSLIQIIIEKNFYPIFLLAMALILIVGGVLVMKRKFVSLPTQTSKETSLTEKS
ncbi:inorganic phosphate transporter [Robertmurraya sp. DFI.2.37]|jgi:sulfate permease|uniref:inorganic phosphate transporter n=1 Tax=Robertmurraya sp. DFI.2.37 TaxID=3031819 RepID=UPI0012468DD2|nr:inorganic phosphate transporter [Robertmurraya sp. DFI.2.37]MDF1508532.1 inorganic phosphate transporter [Robertmurraya sp. DFI.2.37]